MLNRTLVALFTIVLLGAALTQAVAQEEGSKPLKPEQQLELLKKLEPATVVVAYHLKYDRGEEPSFSNPGYNNSTMGRFGYFGDGETLIRQERPLEVGGFLVGPDLVLTHDVQLHPRFLEKLEVHFGDKTVGAKIEAVCKDEIAVLLKLDEPLEGAKPLEFNADAEKPYHVVNYVRGHGRWMLMNQPMGGQVVIDSIGKQYRLVNAQGIIVDNDGAFVGLCTTGYVPVDETWKKPVEKLEQVSAAQYEKLLESLESLSNETVVRVELKFRSPRKNQGGMMMNYYAGDGDSVTEMQRLAVRISAKRLLVLANIDPKVTARLERIRVYDAAGDATDATFVGSLKDYGGLVVELEEASGAGAAMFAGDIRDLEDQMLLDARIEIAGETRVAYLGRTRIVGYEHGHAGQIMPTTASGYGQTQNFGFTGQGELVFLPLTRREKVAMRDRWGGRDWAEAFPSTVLKPVLDNLDEHLDENNVPLTEEEEARLAWLGVVLQPLDPELARVNNVSQQTRNGEFGALVTYIYPGSPAEKVGIEPGMILLQLHVDDQPKPIEVAIPNDRYTSGQPFPWDQLDQLPEQYFDQVPTPWPPAENTFTRMLTDLGFGTDFTAEFIDGEQTVKYDLQVKQSPPHYALAKRYKSEATGLTVRNLTYEVRRLLQKTEDDPGVVISTIEMGSKASVSGVKPFELITHVNEKPVKNIEEFEELTKGGGELTLTVNRMTRNRPVKLTVDAEPEEGEDAAEDSE